MALGNVGTGIGLSSNASGTVIEDNVISANGGNAIEVINSDSVVIKGNLIGTDRKGKQPLGNGGQGILVNFANATQIGGSSVGEGNVISANGGVGIVLANTTDNVVQGNMIGTDRKGKNALGNARDGLFLTSANGSRIGGLGEGEGNVIAYNGGDGVTFEVNNGVGNAILSNAIYANADLGIDLAGDVVTPNDPGDTDDGSNNLQNFPVITRAIRQGHNYKIAGTLESTPNTTFTIQFFANDEVDPSGFGEGKILVATKTVTTDSTGHGEFDFTVSAIERRYSFLSATATDPGGNTSEFSPAVSIGKNKGLDLLFDRPLPWSRGVFGTSQQVARRSAFTSETVTISPQSTESPRFALSTSHSNSVTSQRKASNLNAIAIPLSQAPHRSKNEGFLSAEELTLEDLALDQISVGRRRLRIVSP